MIPRLRMKLPVWAALAIVGVAYVVRSVLMRSGDFTPDLPGDAVVGLLLLVALIITGAMRRGSSQQGTDQSDSQHDDSSGPAHDEREHHGL